MNLEAFTDFLWQKGDELYRDMPWRSETRPYYVLVSEVMLQQTQVSRVIPKFQEFTNRFPDETSLAAASLADVLKQWHGLGYNRRAKFLHEAAKHIIHRGKIPDRCEELVALPGVEKNTAGAILAYSFNQPSIFIETNIRTVYMYHFLRDQFDVDDKQIIQLLEQTLDKRNPRRFYWALMDYGTWLKANGVRNTANSKHYRKQAILRGSIREVRGHIIRELTEDSLRKSEVMRRINVDERFERALAGLVADGLVTQIDDMLHLTK